MSLLTTLESYWKLNEAAAANNAADSVGSNTLTANGSPATGTGKITGCRTFNGSSQYFSIADNASMSTGDIDFTFSAWVRMATKPAAQMEILSKYETASNNREYRILYDNTSDRFIAQVSPDGTSGAAQTVTANNLGSPSAGVWYHILFWHDSVANTINIQVNLGTVDSTAHTTGVLNGVSPFHIGALGRAALGAYFNGDICEVAFWKRVLSRDERVAVWNNGFAITHPFDTRPTQLSQNAIWTWFNEPVAVYDAASRSTIAGWLDSSGNVFIGQYRHTYQTWTYTQLRAALQVDDHANPAVLALANGKFLAAYSVHNGASYSALSNVAGDIRRGFTETTVNNAATYNDSYAHLAQTSDSSSTIFWFFRRDSLQVHYRTTTDGSTWNSPIAFFRDESGNDDRPYFRMCSSGLRIDFAFTDGHPVELATCSLYHFYLLMNADGTDFTLYKSDGTKIDRYLINSATGQDNAVNLPLKPSQVTQVYDGTTNKCWVWDIRNVNGSLQILYPVFSTTSGTDDTHRYRRATLSGGTWTSENICYAGDSSAPGTVGRVPQWIYPDASTAQIHYSPGACLDPNVTDRVYVGKKYGNSDVRIEQWDKSGGTWSQTNKLTGPSGNGFVNARPFPVENASTTQVLWWSASPYTTYLSWTSKGTQSLTPIPTWALKSSTPVFVSAVAPPLTKSYFLLNEGTGSPADLVGTYATSFTGTPTWSDDYLGKNLGGFSTSNYANLDALAAAFSAASFPKGLIVVAKNSSTSEGWAAAFGNSADNDPIFGIVFNQSATTNRLTFYSRDDAGNAHGTFLSDARITDGNMHVYHMEAGSGANNPVTRWIDGASQGTDSSGGGSFGTQTLDRGAIGALRRGAMSQAFGGTVSAVIAYWGGSLDGRAIYNDLINGQFAGTRFVSVGGMLVGPSPLVGLGVLVSRRARNLVSSGV